MPVLTNSPCLTVVLPLFLVSVVIDEVCMVLLFQPPDTIPDLLVPSTPPMCMGPQVKDEYIFTLICAFISDFCPFQFPMNNIHVLKSICFLFQFNFFFVNLICWRINHLWYFIFLQVIFSPLATLFEHFFSLADRRVFFCII